MPTILEGKSTCMVTGAGSAGVPTSVTSVSATPPPCSTSRSTASWAAAAASAGSTPRSKRRDASEGSLCRRAERAIGDRLEVRGLDEHVAGRGPDLGLGATHDAGDRHCPLATVVGDEQVARVEGAVDVVEGLQPLTGTRPAHHERALERGEVEGVQRLAEAEHHVVRDVDRQRDRAHARLGEPDRHPAWCGGRDVEAAHDAGDVAVAAGAVADRRLVAQLDREATVGRRRGGRCQRQGRVGELGAGGVGVLAGDAAHREAVAAVGGDVDLDGLAVEPEQRDGVGAGHEAREGVRVVARTAS